MSRARTALLAALAAVFASAATAQPATPPPLAAAPAKPADVFGKEVTLPPRTMVYISGHADFDNIYESLTAALRRLRGYLDKDGIAPIGPAIARYSDGGESGFHFEAGYPVAEMPKNLPQADIAVGPAPSGKVLDFVHRGSFDKIDETYTAIDDFLRERRGQRSVAPDEEHDELAGSFEEYTTDPLTADPEKVEVHILVPVK